MDKIPQTDSINNLLETLPTIRRARGFRLYTEAGKRLVDLWQCGGAAILGHKPANVVRDMKNAAERGLFAPFPSGARRRFVKALEKLFPANDFRVYESFPGRLELWRPFSSKPVDPPFRPVLPFPLAPAVIVCEKGRAGQFPPSGLVSPLILEAATRAVYDLAAKPERGVMAFKRLEELFDRQDIKKLWRRDGIYLHYEGDAALWPPLFARFLAAGFLLPPSPDAPAILPDELSAGEEAALKHCVEIT
jgi:hypothetical protein